MNKSTRSKVHDAHWCLGFQDIKHDSFLAAPSEGLTAGEVVFQLLEFMEDETKEFEDSSVPIAFWLCKQPSEKQEGGAV